MLGAIPNHPPTPTEPPSLVVAVRESPTILGEESEERAQPFERALLERFADHLGLPLKIVRARSNEQLFEWLESGKVNLAAGWFTESAQLKDRHFVLSESFHVDNQVLIQRNNERPIEDIKDLTNRTIHVASGSRYAATAKKLATEVPDLVVVEQSETADTSGIDMLRAVADGTIDFTITSGEIANIAKNYYPNLQEAITLSDDEPIGWLFPASIDKTLLNNANTVLAQWKKDGTLNRLHDTHLAFRNRINRADVVRFLSRMRTTLPKYQGLFLKAQARTNIDWRLIAALAYQESQWDPFATSFTGVRGLMMLTKDTADHMRVTNRLDPIQSIRAGADYLANLRDRLPENIKEPDRTWLALAAYNIGMGHLSSARTIAANKKADPNDWYEMKRILPLLSRPEVYSRLKSGKARGGEAVILVENVRAFHDILSRYAPAYPLMQASLDIDNSTSSPSFTPRLTSNEPETQQVSLGATNPRL